MVEKTPMAGWWPEFFEPLRQVGERVADWFTPRSDAASVADAYHINIELPGVSEKDIDIQLHDGVMTVQGEKKMERTEEKPGYFFSERQYGRFQRTFRLPADAVEDGVSASFADGVLRISVPKRGPAQPKARKIEIDRG